MLMVMKLTILYRERSEHARSVANFLEMMRRQYPGRTARLLDIDTRDGAAEASLYGVTRYPAFVVTAIDGRVMQQWEGDPLPIMGEVASMISGQEGAY